MQKILTLVVVVVVAIAGVWLYMSGSMMADKGRVVFAVTDASASLDSISSVTMSVNKVEVQSSSQAWVTVSSKPYDFDLLKLKNSGVFEVLADVKLNADTYNQIRLNISKVVVVKGGQSFEAKLPSNELKIVGKTVVESGGTSSAVLDFLLDKSLHVTGNGQFVFAPVVRLIAKSGTEVTVDANGIVKVLAQGKIEEDITIGMDEKGETKEDFEINSNSKVEIVGGEIKVGVGVGVQAGWEPITVNLSSQNSSGISGKAMVTEVDGRAQVKIELTGALLGLPQPAHVHVGSCATIGGVKYPLSNVLSGKSTTVLSVSMADLKAGLPLAVNVHKSVAESGTYVACGDVKF